MTKFTKLFKKQIRNYQIPLFLKSLKKNRKTNSSGQVRSQGERTFFNLKTVKPNAHKNTQDVPVKAFHTEMTGIMPHYL